MRIKLFEKKNDNIYEKFLYLQISGKITKFDLRAKGLETCS